MNITEAVQLLGTITLLDPFAKKRSEDEIVAIAQVIAESLPSADLPWALSEVQAGLRKGQVPNIPDLVSAWQREARRRVEAVPVPAAPPEIENDPLRWKEWERARRAALIKGSSESDAITRADRQVGLPPARRQIAAPAASTAKQDVFRQLAEWDRKQRQAMYETEFGPMHAEGGEQQ